MNTRRYQHVYLRGKKKVFPKGRGNRRKREMETALSPSRPTELVESLKYVHTVLTGLFVKTINLFLSLKYTS